MCTPICSSIHAIAVDSAPDGHPKLATFLSSDRNFMQYRAFNYLHARLLLSVQHGIEALERELDELDQADATGDNEDRSVSETCGDIEVRTCEGANDRIERPRSVVMADLEKRLMAYGKAHTWSVP